MTYRLFSIAMLLLLLTSFVFSQYLTYDGVNIHFGNESQISVFTCNEEKCFPGFANIAQNGSSIFPSAQPLSDDFVNITLDYEFNKTEVCTLKFVSESPLSVAPSDDNSVVIFFNEVVSFAIISVSESSAPFFLDHRDEQVCLGTQNEAGMINFVLASPLWVQKNVEIEPSQDETLKDDEIVADEILNKIIPPSENKEKTSSDEASLKPEYVAIASVAVFLTTVLFVFFSRRKKISPDLTPLITKSDRTSDMGIELVDEKKVREAEKVLHEMLED